MQTLILDGLSVTAEFCHELILDPAYNIRILSIRGAKNLNERKLCQTLRYACRPSRPENTPRLKAMYVFGERDYSAASLPSTPSTVSSIDPFDSAEDLRDEWYERRGKMVSRSFVEEWAATLVDCRGIIAFDAMPCQGPRHLNSPAYGKVPSHHIVEPPSMRNPQWAVAEFALPPCAGCGAAPEGVIMREGTSPSELPLLAPPPMFASSVKAATLPDDATRDRVFVARCGDCVRDRYCHSCTKWWCEDCYVPPTAPMHSSAALSLAETDVVIVNPEGDAWVQHHEGEQLRAADAKPKVRDGSCYPYCSGRSSSGDDDDQPSSSRAAGSARNS